VGRLVVTGIIGQPGRYAPLEIIAQKLDAGLRVFVCRAESLFAKPGIVNRVDRHVTFAWPCRAFCRHLIRVADEVAAVEVSCRLVSNAPFRYCHGAVGALRTRR